MQPKIHAGDQRTPEWFQLRSGRLSGSRASEMLAKIRTGESALRRNLRMELCLERVLGHPLEETGYVSPAMEWGVEQEPHALARYESEVLADDLRLVTQVAYVSDETLLVGCSPDGLVEDDGVVEVKCPKQANFWAMVEGGVIPPKYLPQLRHTLWVTGRSWIDFVAYDPRFPEPLQLFVRRLSRQEAKLEEYEKLALAFLKECDQQVTRMQEAPCPMIQITS